MPFRTPPAITLLLIIFSLPPLSLSEENQTITFPNNTAGLGKIRAESLASLFTKENLQTE